MRHWKWIIVGLWIGLNPALRLLIYPLFSLKTFIDHLEWLSFGVLTFEALSLWFLYRSPKPTWPSAFRLRSWIDAFVIFPFFWLSIALFFFTLVEFGILQDVETGPLYDSQLYLQRHPLGWTGVSFIASAFLEEIFFRAWLPDTLQTRFKKSTAILLSAVLYTAAHISSHSNSLTLSLHMVFALGLSYARSFHGLGAAMGLHLLNNLMVYTSEVHKFQLLNWIGDTPWRYYYIAAPWCVASGLMIGRDLKKLVDKGSSDP